MGSIIELKDVSVTIGHKQIVKNIDLSVPQGKITAIIGPNGCGKSTTLKAICRSLPCATGNITLLGKGLRDYGYKEFAQRVAILTQSPQSPADLTVQDLVGMGRFPYRSFLGRATKEDDECVQWAMQETNVWEMRHRVLSTLSGGERQRAWIAMALAQKPTVLILDEPTTYLDISHQLEVMKLLARLNRELNLTVVLVLHELNQALQYADFVAVMKEGRLVATGAPQQVIDASLLKQVFRVKADTFSCSNGLQALVPVDLYQKEQE